MITSETAEDVLDLLDDLRALVLTERDWAECDGELAQLEQALIGNDDEAARAAVALLAKRAKKPGVEVSPDATPAPLGIVASFELVNKRVTNVASRNQGHPDPQGQERPNGA